MMNVLTAQEELFRATVVNCGSAVDQGDHAFTLIHPEFDKRLGNSTTY